MTDTKTIQSPGDALSHAMQQRGWTQEVLARIIGRSPSVLSAISNGKRAISAELAREFEAAFGIPAETWLRIEAEYQLAQVAKPQEVVERARVFERAPVKEMERRGWIKRTHDVAALEGELCRFFGVTSLSENPKLKVAARSSIKEGFLNEAQVAWSYRALHLAPAIHAAKYTPAKLKDALPELRAMAAQPELARHVPRILSESGVRLVIVEHLTGYPIYGAALWLNDKSPVIALSLHGNKMDRFWHTLQHEISHVLHKDGEMLDVDLGEAGLESWSINVEVEKRANSEAADALIDTARMTDFIRRKKHLFTRMAVVQFANLIKIHPCIVVGQLQHRKEINWDVHTKLLPSIREHIVGEALTDGFGCQPEI